jgi:hypothetical protein
VRLTRDSALCGCERSGARPGDLLALAKRWLHVEMDALEHICVVTGVTIGGELTLGRVEQPSRIALTICNYVRYTIVYLDYNH